MVSQELYARVEQALESIRSYLQADQGDVRIHRISDAMEVELELLGSCSACSMSDMTMKAGIEQAILRAVPEITRISTINPVN